MQDSVTRNPEDRPDYVSPTARPCPIFLRQNDARPDPDLPHPRHLRERVRRGSARESDVWKAVTRPLPHAEHQVFRWSGWNSHRSRLNAGERLAERILADDANLGRESESSSSAIATAAW